MLQTEYAFELPLGYADAEGSLQKNGLMRLATAADEILPLKDPRVKNNQAYLIIILLSRVISKLGTLSDINPKTIEGLFSADLHYLQEVYNRINSNGKMALTCVCPKCEHEFETEVTSSGG